MLSSLVQKLKSAIVEAVCSEAVWWWQSHLNWKSAMFSSQWVSEGIVFHEEQYGYLYNIKQKQNVDFSFL